MHIGIDARLTYYRTGGISTYIRHLISELEQQDTTNQYTVYHSRKATETLPTRFQRANLWTPSHHRIERTALSVELARHNLDIFHSPDFIPPRRGGRRHVISIMDLSFLHYPQFMTTESRRYYNDQIEAAVAYADHILAISHATRQDVIDMLNVPPDKITVHLLAADHIFKPQPLQAIAAMRQQLDLPAAYLLFVGTFEPRKNIPGLLKGYQLLLGDLPDAPPLVLAGNRGWLFDEAMREIEGMGLGDRVLWRERIPQELLPPLYSGALVHLLPSFYEGFGLPALEAMACGTVSIVSNRSSMPEVVGDVGQQIDPDDPATIAAALYKALTDTNWRTDQEALALEQAARFTWTETGRVALAAYQKVMGN